MATSNTIDATAFQYVQPEVVKVTEPSTVIIDDAEQFGRFEERTTYILDKFEYPRKGREPGLLIIFNQVHFNNEKTRTGSYKDVNEIILCFSRLGFNIRSKHVFTDLTKSEMYSAIHTVLEDDLSEFNCLIVFFLTHGTNKNKLMTRDKTFSATAVWKQFAENKDLLHKPKLFIFQACKGSNHPKPSDLLKKVFIVPHTTFTVDSILPDMVIVFSSVEGSVSFRNNESGSWFIQELCRNFSTYGRRDDVITLLLRTNKCVARNYVSEYGCQQMPVFISTLNKMFYLNRNKDRSALQEFNQNNDEILRSLNDLNMRVEEMKELTRRKHGENYQSENNT
ncbi:caspase-6-like [Coccinella septempunctata]|uniref:caspase-6-like n=1 Tax=Coccinella septempunctata TaxID=41139 RepID=UPI001D05C36C|nr:caspase-6-like [Coccinella septempunctata]